MKSISKNPADRLPLCVVVFFVLVVVSVAQATRYLASSYNDTQKLCIYTSSDGIKFRTLYEDIYTAESPSTAVRDPDIIKIGNYYYSTFTTSSAGNTAIDIIRSTDLKNWTRIAQKSINSVTWAPQWFIESDGTVHIIANLAVDGVYMRPFETHPTNSTLTAWSDWAAITGTWSEGANATNLEYNMHDIFIIKKDTTYYAFFGCAETLSAHYGDIQYATSSSLLSGYTIQGVVADRSDYGPLGDGWDVFEGPCVILMPNGTYRLYFDFSERHGIYYMDSNDLITWGTPALTSWPTADGTTRHPTVREYDKPYSRRGRYTGGSFRERYE